MNEMVIRNKIRGNIQKFSMTYCPVSPNLTINNNVVGHSPPEVPTPSKQAQQTRLLKIGLRVSE